MVHFNKSVRTFYVWIITLLFWTGSVQCMSAQNQNCADVDFSFEVFGNTVRLTGQSEDNIQQWFWQFGNGTSATGKTATITYTKNGVYEICLKVIAVGPVANTNAGCTGIICKKVTIGSISDNDDDCGLKADFDFVVSGTDIKLKGKSTDTKATYLWTISGQNAQKTGQQVVFSTDRPGVYEVCLVVVNGDETCKVRVCKKIQIGQGCTLEADFSFEIIDGIFRFTAKSNLISTSLTGFEYFWDFGDGNTSSGITTKHQYANDGIFNVCLTVKDTRTGCTTKICKTVTSDANCDLKADFKAFTSLTGASFTARSNSSNAKYYWDFGNGSRAEGVNVRAMYDKPGIYTVCLTVVDDVKKCKVQVCKRVLIGRNTSGPTVTDSSNPGIDIYPNPATDIVNIESKSLKIQQLTIYNFQQLAVIQKSPDNNLVTLYVASLPEGIYVVHLILEDGTPFAGRFYKK